MSVTTGDVEEKCTSETVDDSDQKHVNLSYAEADDKHVLHNLTPLLITADDDAVDDVPGPSGLSTKLSADFDGNDVAPVRSRDDSFEIDSVNDIDIPEHSGLISSDLLNLRKLCPSGVPAESEELEKDSMKIVMLLAINEAYAESLEKLIRNVQYAIMENKKRQDAIRSLMGRTASASDFYGNTKKVPVSQFHPPYFRDRFGMIPPANVETQRKLMSGDYDPLVKPERKWLPKDLDRLRTAVKREVADSRCSLQKKRRAELQEMLKKSGQETTDEERSTWLEEINSLTRYIEYIRNLSDEEVFGSEYDYGTVDWSKIATYDFLDTRSATQLRLKWNNEQSPKWSKAKWDVKEVEKLRGLATGPWVRWGVISRLLGTGRTPFQCFLKYKLDCDKESKLAWSKEEDTALITLCHSLRINGKIPWEKVCYYMEGRSRQQCKVRYDRTLDVDLRHGRWSEQEDILLKCAVGRFGKNWKQVASCVPGRTDAQCRDRWVNILDEKIKDSPWTLEEDEKLLRGVREIGKEWARIALMLPGRTGDHCKTRFRSLMVTRLKLHNRDVIPPKLIRRHDTTKQRRERRKVVEKHFEELLAGDGQDEVARELANFFKTESLSIECGAALDEAALGQHDNIVSLVQKRRRRPRNGDSEVASSDSTKKLHRLLHGRLSMRPELFDNVTRTMLLKAYERSALKRCTGRRPKAVLSVHEKNGFSESLDSLPSEEDKKNFLMDHLVELMSRSDNADQCFMHQHIPKNQCVEDLKYHLSEELVNETERRVWAEGELDEKCCGSEFNPLPPFTASLKVYSSLTNMIPTLRNRALWSFSGLKGDNGELCIQLSSEIKRTKWYRALKMKLRSLLFWPALMDQAIGFGADLARGCQKKEIRRISDDLKSLRKSKSKGAALVMRDLTDVRRRTKLKLPNASAVDKSELTDSDKDNRPPSHSSAEIAEQTSSELACAGEGDCVFNLRPEAERLLMIDECIASVRQKVVAKSLDCLLEEYGSLANGDRTAADADEGEGWDATSAEPKRRRLAECSNEADPAPSPQES